MTLQLSYSIKMLVITLKGGCSPQKPRGLDPLSKITWIAKEVWMLFLGQQDSMPKASSVNLTTVLCLELQVALHI